MLFCFKIGKNNHFKMKNKNEFVCHSIFHYMPVKFYFWLNCIINTVNYPAAIICAGVHMHFFFIKIILLFSFQFNIFYYNPNLFTCPSSNTVPSLLYGHNDCRSHCVYVCADAIFSPYTDTQ